MWVVKLGGSLADSAHLPLWLAALECSRTVIVPGGGPFAEQVRQTQKRWAFDDGTAHHMAILAMCQYGMMLAALRPGLGTATRAEQLLAAGGRAVVWLPLPEQLNAAGVPASWDITSDSLAAWLAGRLGARQLLLVKSVASFAPEGAPQAQSIGCQALVREGLVDPAFPEYAEAAGCPVWLCGPDSHAGLSAALGEPEKHFTRMS